MGQNYQKQLDCSMQSPSINSTVSLLSGGWTDANSYSPLTWYFNHETNVFSSGPSLLQGRFRHGSATIVDKVTKAKIPMVTGGYGNGGRLDVNRTANAMGIWQSRYYSSAQKLQPLL